MSLVEGNAKAKGNLIPTYQQTVINTIFGNQQKFNTVMEKIIEALDRLDNNNSIIINEVLEVKN